MATRFHLPSDIASPVSVTDPGGWGTTGGSGTVMVTGRVGAPSPAVGFSAVDTPVAGTARERPLVSFPLRGSGTLAGTIKAFALVKATTGAVTTRMSAWIVSEDGTTVRGTLLAVGNYGTGNALNSGANQVRAFASAGTSLSPVAWVEGDRVVVAFGFGAVSGAAATQYGDNLLNATTDAGENETGTTGQAWIEFSQDFATWQVVAEDIAQPAGGNAVTAVSTVAPITFQSNSVYLCVAFSLGASATVATPASSASSPSNSLVWALAGSALSPYAPPFDNTRGSITLFYAVTPAGPTAASVITATWSTTQGTAALIVMRLDANLTTPIGQVDGGPKTGYPVALSLPGVSPSGAVFILTFDEVTVTGTGHARATGFGERVHGQTFGGLPLTVTWAPIATPTPTMGAGSGGSNPCAALAFEVLSARPVVQCVRGQILVTDVSPTPGSVIGRTGALHFRIRDTTTAFRRVLPRIRYPNLGWGEFVHDGDAFLSAFSGSSRVLISGPGQPEEWVYDLIRADPWPDRVITLTPFAGDASGSESPPYVPPGPTPGACPLPGTITVTAVSPTPGTGISPDASLRFTIADSLWAFRRILPGLDFPDLKRREFTHDGDTFEMAYAGSSRRLLSTPGAPEVWEYTLTRQGGWLGGRVTLFPYAFDVEGGAN